MGSAVLMALTPEAGLGIRTLLSVSRLATHWTDETLIAQTQKQKTYIFMKNCLLRYLGMKEHTLVGIHIQFWMVKSRSMATQASALASVKTLMLRTTSIEFSVVAMSGAIAFMIVWIRFSGFSVIQC